MEKKVSLRIASFFRIICWVYFAVAAAMIGLALYSFTNTSASLTLGGITDAVFAVIGGALGIAASVMGLISKRMKRCRMMGLILLAVAVVPLVIHLLAGETFGVYWKNILLMVMPALYLIGALLKRSAKPPQEKAGVPPIPAQTEEKPSET